MFCLSSRALLLFNTVGREWHAHENVRQHERLGEGQKAEIMGKVKREFQVVMSSANREAEEIKGKADAEAANIYASAYNQDPEFYAFSKSLESYKMAMGKNTHLIISSDSEFFKYLDKLK